MTEAARTPTGKAAEKGRWVGMNRPNNAGRSPRGLQHCTARELEAVPHHDDVVLGMPDVEETFPKCQPVCCGQMHGESKQTCSMCGWGWGVHVWGGVGRAQGGVTTTGESCVHALCSVGRYELTYVHEVLRG